MASLARENSRRHDTRRRRRHPAGRIESDADAESGLDDLDPQLHASHHQRKSQKQQKPTHVTFNGPVTISGEILAGREGRNARRRDPSPLVTRRSTGRLRAANKRPTTEHDSQSESSTDSEAYSSSSSVDSASHNGLSMRHAKSKAPAEGLQVPSSHRTKRHNPDEGYHTSGTASYGVEQSKQSSKGKAKVAASKPRGDLARPACTKQRREKALPRKADTAEPQSDASDNETASDINGIAEDGHAEEDASDEEFGKLVVQIGCTDGSIISEEAVLDTGTKPDWISQTFFEALRKKVGIKSVKLAPEETRKYRDFNGKSFSPTHKVDLMIQSDEFLGMKYRNLSFLIARDATFSILIGRSTIFKQELMARRKRKIDGEGAHVGVLGDVSKAEKSRIKKNKEDQDKTKQERKKQREAKMEEEETNKQRSRTKQFRKQFMGDLWPPSANRPSILSTFDNKSIMSSGEDIDDTQDETDRAQDITWSSVGLESGSKPNKLANVDFKLVGNGAEHSEYSVSTSDGNTSDAGPANVPYNKTSKAETVKKPLQSPSSMSKEHLSRAEISAPMDYDALGQSEALVSGSTRHQTVETDWHPLAPNLNGIGAVSDSEASDSVNSIADSLRSSLSQTVSTAGTSIYGQSEYDVSVRLVDLLYRDPVLEDLYQEALDKVDIERLERNLRRLLKIFAVDLREEAKTAAETSAAGFIRRRAKYSAHLLCSRLGNDTNNVMPAKASRSRALELTAREDDSDDNNIYMSEAGNDNFDDDPTVLLQLVTFVIRANAFEKFRLGLRNFLHPGERTNLQDTATPEPAGKVTKCKATADALKYLATRAFEVWSWEPRVPKARVRVRWKCRCGQSLYDDYEEIHPGAARLREISLNRRNENSGNRTRLTAPENGPSSSSIIGFSLFSVVLGSLAKLNPWKEPQLPCHNAESIPLPQMLGGSVDVQSENIFLLLCYRGGVYTTMLLELPIADLKSDYQLFVVLRSHYMSLRSKWRTFISFRTLRSIKFIRFVVYKKSQSVDIQSEDDIPPPDHTEYRYAPVPTDVVPPVGSRQLMHFFHHPDHAEDEPECLERFPKKLKDRLTARGKPTEVGWGIHLVEGLNVKKIWIVCFVVFGIGGVLLGILWSIFKKNIQDAFGISAVLVALSLLTVGFTQAMLEDGND